MKIIRVKNKVIKKQDANEQSVLNAMKKLAKSVIAVKKDYFDAIREAKAVKLDNTSDTFYDIYNQLADIGFMEDSMPDSMADSLAKAMKIQKWFE